MVVIDGSMGEGGGQIIRSSLTLSLITGEPFTVTNVRAKRSRPGLLRQHVTAVAAAAEISQADVRGGELGSRELVFRPGKVRPGRYRFSIGTAGSTTLVFQTILPALVVADGPSELTLEGGTHNPFAPPFDFLDRAFLPCMSRMGPQVDCSLEKPGFYPAGGGRFKAVIEPVRKLGKLEILERGDVKGRRARAVVSKVPAHVAKRELATVKKLLGWDDQDFEQSELKESHGPGNVLLLEMIFANITELFTGFGEKGVSAEEVAGKACREVQEYLASGAPVGKYLADQLLIPLAMAGEGSFHTTSPDRHTITNSEVIRRFLNVDITCAPVGERVWRIAVAS